MAKIINIKNTTLVDTDWVGHTILAGETYSLPIVEASEWSGDPEVFASIASGDLLINNGTADLTNPTEGYNWLHDINDFPLSDVDGKKIAVHSSSKPLNNGNIIYAMWIGAGDDMATEAISEGEMMQFVLSPGLASKSVDVQFHKNNGKVWLHEGYLKFMSGGFGDYIDASVVAKPTPLQTSVNLDLEIVNTDIIQYAAGGPGTGTHGFADPDVIVLLPRTFSMDGEWDYDGTSLTPNLSNTGEYRIRTVEQVVHKFMHRISAYGDCNTYFSMTSEEASELLPNYIFRVTAHNVSNSSWNANVLMEVYRERTFNP